METETFECAHKVSYAAKEGNGKYSIYVTKDDGTDMTVYGEALGAESWAKGARLKITAQPAKQSKNMKWYQTATSVEKLDGDVTIPSGATPTTTVTKDPAAQWKEKFRLTASNLVSSFMSTGKVPTDNEYDAIQEVVRKILNAETDQKDESFKEQF